MNLISITYFYCDLFPLLKNGREVNASNPKLKGVELPGVDGESLRLWFFDSGGNHPDPKIRHLGGRVRLLNGGLCYI